jgi:hypothetical protein
MMHYTQHDSERWLTQLEELLHSACKWTAQVEENFHCLECCLARNSELLPSENCKNYCYKIWEDNIKMVNWLSIMHARGCVKNTAIKYQKTYYNIVEMSYCEITKFVKLVLWDATSSASLTALEYLNCELGSGCWVEECTEWLFYCLMCSVGLEFCINCNKKLFWTENVTGVE